MTSRKTLKNILIVPLALMIPNFCDAQNDLPDVVVPYELRQTGYATSSLLQRTYSGSTRRLSPSSGKFQSSPSATLNQRNLNYSFQNNGIPNPDQRREIRQMPIESRPYRPIHFYGNTVRRLNRR